MWPPARAEFFLIETKARRRRKSRNQQPEQVVVYDGKALQFPWGYDAEAVLQTERNAGCLTDPLHLSRGLVGMLIAFSPLYLLAGSFTASGWLWLEGRPAQARKRAAEFLKMPCPSCGGHVKFSVQNLGRKIACPHCRKEMTLRKPEENLKMACVLCGGHVEFPPHAVGQKILCPHYAKTITLLKPALEIYGSAVGVVAEAPSLCFPE